MSNAKYIIVQLPSGLEFGVTFPPWVSHDNVAQRFVPQFSRVGEVILGAGEFSIGEPQEEDSRGFMRPSVSCFGKSVSLDVKSRGDEDAKILKASLFGQG